MSDPDPAKSRPDPQHCTQYYVSIKPTYDLIISNLGDNRYLNFNFFKHKNRHLQRHLNPIIPSPKHEKMHTHRPPARKLISQTVIFNPEHTQN